VTTIAALPSPLPIHSRTVSLVYRPIPHTGGGGNPMCFGLALCPEVGELRVRLDGLRCAGTATPGEGNRVLGNCHAYPIRSSVFIGMTHLTGVRPRCAAPQCGFVSVIRVVSFGTGWWRVVPPRLRDFGPPPRVRVYMAPWQLATLTITYPPGGPPAT
jgi:hypothetical protein